jgi:integrase
MPQEKLTNQMKRVWAEFTAFKSRFLHPNTIEKQYKRWEQIIDRLPSYVEKGKDVLDWMDKHYSSETTRRFFMMLNAAYLWGERVELVKENPFAPYVGTIRKTAYNRREAFSAQERDRIIDQFQKRDPYYYAYVSFTFKVGCRHEEARALQWEDIGSHSIHFRRALATGTRKVGPLKTGVERKFPLSETLKEILSSQRGLHHTLVFPSLEGAHLETSNFVNRHWIQMVKPLAINGTLDQYLPPSHTRHTFITLALRAGVPVADVAKLVGNSSDTIWKHYAQASRDIILPEF